jgi:hypothetical protein
MPSNLPAKPHFGIPLHTHCGEVLPSPRDINYLCFRKIKVTECGLVVIVILE